MDKKEKKKPGVVGEESAGRGSPKVARDKQERECAGKGGRQRLVSWESSGSWELAGQLGKVGLGGWGIGEEEEEEEGELASWLCLPACQPIPLRIRNYAAAARPSQGDCCLLVLSTSPSFSPPLRGKVTKPTYLLPAHISFRCGGNVLTSTFVSTAPRTTYRRASAHGEDGSESITLSLWITFERATKSLDVT